MRPEDIEYAKMIFEKYNCKTLNGYMLKYLEIDVLLLAEVFERFIITCKKRYRIDPTWFYTTPGYSWSVAFYKTKQRLEILSDRAMIDFFLKNAIRGGISTVCRKKVLEANNKYMGELYNPSVPDNYIMYLDVTNLYVNLK